MSKIKQSARGEPCLVRIPGVCISGGDNETTVLAHLNGGGMGKKHPDCEAAYCCSACHDVIDYRVKYAYPLGGMLGRDERDEVNRLAIKNMHQDGCVRTRKRLIEKGLLVLK
jgi:hypothetical protein